MSGGTHLRSLAPGQHSSEETLERWRAIDESVVPDSTGRGVLDLAHRSDVFNHYAHRDRGSQIS